MHSVSLQSKLSNLVAAHRRRSPTPSGYRRSRSVIARPGSYKCGTCRRGKLTHWINAKSSHRTIDQTNTTDRLNRSRSIDRNAPRMALARPIIETIEPRGGAPAAVANTDRLSPKPIAYSATVSRSGTYRCGHADEGTLTRLESIDRPIDQTPRID